MQKIFDKIMQEFGAQRAEEFKANPLADFIRNETSQSIKELMNLDSNDYLVEGSPGKGRWADVPWIAIFDKRITTTAQSGYYIVYLFSKDMERVYLSLNQGVTWFKEKFKKDSQQRITSVTEYWQKELSLVISDYSVLQIDLGSNLSDLGKGYEFGHICGKVYERNSLPDNNTLAEDLRGMLNIYKMLASKLQQIDSNFDTEKLNCSILAEITTNV